MRISQIKGPQWIDLRTEVGLHQVENHIRALTEKVNELIDSHNDEEITS